MFRAKNQYDKMEEKKLCGAEKTIYLNRRTRACGTKKRMYRNGRINVSKQKKKLNSDFWKTIMEEIISFNFLCFQREFKPKFKPFLLC